MKIFWSWQSDYDGKISRHFIKECIETAMSELSQEVEFTDREFALDHDTKDIPGSPPITETIFEKINGCDVFIADVTPVAETKGGKKIMNPNVAIEMGYAIAKLSNRKILTVMNKEYGDINDLPFDLSYKRGPVFYQLKVDDNKTPVKKALVLNLKEAIKLYAVDLVTSPLVLEEASPIFFDEKEPIVRLESDVWGGVRDKPYLVKMNNSFLYTKLIPLSRVELSKKAIKEHMFVANRFTVPLIYGSPSNTPVTNKFGAILVKFDSREGESAVTDLVQVFKDGKVVSISNSFLKNRTNNSIPLRLLYQCLKENVKGSLSLIKLVTGEDMDVAVEVGIINKDSCTVIRQHPKGSRQYVDPEVGPLEEELYKVSKKISTSKSKDIDILLEKLIVTLMDDIGIEFNFANHEW